MAAPALSPIRTPDWTLVYNGVDISPDLSGSLLSVNYVDQLSEVSGELEIVVEDHRQVWQSAWYPSLGDEIDLTLGYKTESRLPCGTFQIDQIELSGPPDTFTMRCLAAFITPAMRTRNSLGFENQTLIGIAQSIAGKYGLTLINTADVIDVPFDRITQKLETDLGFLKRLAMEYDYDFTIRGGLMVFYSRESLEAAPPSLTFTRSDLTTFEFRNRTHETYASASLAYSDPLSKSLINQSIAAVVPTGGQDILKIVSRVENGQQAALKARAALNLRDRFFFDAVLTMPGNSAVAAGNAFVLSGFGNFDGTYIVRTARHRIDRAGGYMTGMEATRVF